MFIEEKGTLLPQPVKVMQGWGGFRPRANPLYYHFYIYLTDRKLNAKESLSKLSGQYNCMDRKTTRDFN